MELKCPHCRIPVSLGDIYCSKCGTRIQTDHDAPLSDDSFSLDLMDLLDALNGFRAWIDQRKKTNVRFMKAYKKRLDELDPAIKQFKHKYDPGESSRLEQFELVEEIFTCYRRPVRYMETKLRPSIGMGIWQARWMMTSAVGDYLKVCCREADRLSDELKHKLPFCGKAE